MRLRAVHLACFMLLLSSIAAAETRAARAENFDPHVHYASLLMQQSSTAGTLEDAFPCGTAEALKLPLPVAARAQVATVWTMRPPSAQGAQVQDFTGNRV